MEIRNEATTGRKGIGDQTYMFTSEFAPIAAIRGSFGIDRGKKRVDFSNKFPEYTCARYFEDYLKGKGISCSKGAADFKLKNDWIKDGIDSAAITIIGQTESPDLRRIAFTTNHVSNNLYAETLIKTLGAEFYGSTTYESSRKALEEALRGMGLDPSKGLSIQDGSGLSRQNYISSDFFCRFLLGMMESPHFEHFVNSLPSPGSDGSMIYNMRKYSDSIKSRIKVKSGSMNGVRCYSGYVIPTDGGKEDVIIFSLMINNCTASSTQMRNILDSMMAELASEN
jgi:D-alanyl-D-alanine carboxypeptidase/D-alanyl-D-alanine-endopeptidase (penicillin-binding protein 4)